MRRIGLTIVILGVMLWIAGCGKSKPAKTVTPTPPTPEAQPDKQPTEQPAEQPATDPAGQPDETPAAAKSGPDSKKVADAVGSALFKSLTGGSDDQAQQPGAAPAYKP